MRRVQHRKAAVGIAATCALAAGLIAVPATSSSAHGAPTFTTIISGLNTPRGLAFDNKGNLYVSQSGIPGNAPAGLNRTGRVSKYAWGSSTPEWSHRYQMFFASEGGGPPDALGPEGLGVACEHGSSAATGSGSGRGNCKVQLIMSESQLGIRAASHGALRPRIAGKLFGLNPATGARTKLSNVGNQSYRFTNRHKFLFSDFPDSNPFGILVTNTLNNHSGYGGQDRTRTFIADSGANTINEVMPSGRIRVIAYIPNEKRAPKRDSTPTCIAQGPDGYLYVGTLDLVANLPPFSGGRSKIWRVNPNANFPTKPQLWAKGGLTTLTSCTFDRAGNFWATELLKNPTSKAPGDVVKIPFDNPSKRTYIGAGKLPVPIGIAQGPDGAMYVNTGSAGPPGTGAVVRIGLHPVS